MLISSNISVPPPVSLCAAPPSSLKPELGRTPSLCVVGQDEDDDLEVESEEDPPESNQDIRLDLDLESDYDSVPQSSSLSSLPRRQP